MNRRCYIDGEMFVQETTCPKPMVAQKMHTHKPDRSHLTSVISGSIKIFDTNGWETIVSAGETIDLCDKLEHAISTITPNTVYKNMFPVSRVSDEEIQGAIGAGVLSYKDED